MSERITKSKSPVYMTTDLLVKLGNIYNDCYILSLSHIVVGNNPSDRILGTLMCKLEQPYKEAIQELAGSIIPCMYVDVTPAKKWLQGLKELLPTEEIKKEFKKYFIEITDEERSSEIRKKAEDIESRFIPEDCNKQPLWWKCVGEDKRLVSSVFNVKAIFNMPIYTTDKSTPFTVMTISKQVLPLVTEKNIDNCYIGTAGKILDEDPNVLEVLLWFQFTHFKMMIIYNILILPWIPEDTSEDDLGSLAIESMDE